MERLNGEDLNNDHGFLQAKPFAKKKIIKGANGQNQVIYVDARTGKQVNPKGYTVIESDNTVDTTNIQPTQTQSNVEQPQTTTNTDIVLNDGNGHRPDDSKGNVSDAAKDSGYINKPGWAGFAGMVPGPIGLVGKLGNVGINAHNNDLVNNERDALGLSKQGFVSNVKNTLTDGQGLIGNIKTTRPNGTDEVTPVSFEGTDPNGRTALTPNEARMRQQLNPETFTEATQQETKRSIGQFNSDFPEQRSVMAKMADAASGFFSNIFGGNPTQNGGGTYSGDVSSFPSRPTPPTNNSGSPDDRDKNINESGSPDDRDGNTPGKYGGYDHPGLF